MKDPAETARDVARDIPRALDADPLTLTPYRFPKIVQLVFHYVADCLASGIDIIAHLLDRIVDRNAVEQFTATVHRAAEAALGPRGSPASAFRRAATSPPRAFQSAIASPLGALEAG